jgi:hypothetical protein
MDWERVSLADDGEYRHQAGVSVSAAMGDGADCAGNPGLQLRDELLRRRDADQAARSALTLGAAGALATTMSIDDDNAAWLRHVIAEWGWPGHSLVGEEGSHAAWLVAQHADRDPSLQRRCLKLLEQAVAAGEASPGDFAFLTDRVLLASGATQIYGTQMAARVGRYVACRLRDPETVDARRASVGLETLDDYLCRMLELHGPPSPARVICPKCRAEIETWLPELGGKSIVECVSCHTSYALRPSIPTV